MENRLEQSENVQPSPGKPAEEERISRQLVFENAFRELREGRASNSDTQASSRSTESASPSSQLEESKQETQEQEQKQETNDEEESLALARRLMQEESMLAYRQLQQASVQFALQNREQGEEDEDLALALRLMQEEMSVTGADHRSLLEAVEVANMEEEKEQGGEYEEVDPEQMTYDELLQLGEELGDVRQERWRLRAQSVIDSLPTETFRIPVANSTPKPSASPAECSVPSRDSTKREWRTDDSVPNKRRRSLSPQPAGGGNGAPLTEKQPAPAARPLITPDKPLTSWKCLVCQCEYEDGEELRVLPCAHRFHKDCIDTWLSSQWKCCLCKKSVTGSSP